MEHYAGHRRLISSRCILAATGSLEAESSVLFFPLEAGPGEGDGEAERIGGDGLTDAEFRNARFFLVFLCSELRARIGASIIEKLEDRGQHCRSRPATLGEEAAITNAEWACRRRLMEAELHSERP